MMRKSILFFALMFVSVTSFAQRTTQAKDGNYSFLKGVKEVNVVFDYEGMTVGKDMTEQQYVEEKVAEKNKEKPGTGDEWRESWEKAKVNAFEPMFLKALNKRVNKSGLTFSQGDNAEMTLIVKITRIEPGFFSYAVNRKAEIDALLSFVSTGNNDDIKSQVVMTKIYGTADPAVSSRIQYAFSVAGTMLGKYIAKAIK